MKCDCFLLEENIYKSDLDLFHYLENVFKSKHGYMFGLYPNIKLLDRPLMQANIFLLMPDYGTISIIIDNMVINRNNDFEKIVEKTELIDTSIYATLMKNKGFRANKRSLKFNVKTIIYLPNCMNIEDIELETEYEVFNSMSDLVKHIENDKSDYCLNNEEMEEILAFLESSYATIRPKERFIKSDDDTSKAYVLHEIETQLARFDSGQRVAALMNLEGPQRIRGLAGSGKTIVLCMKAALLLLKYPDCKILYTFYTKSLYDYIKQLITRFYSNLSDGLMPDFDNSIYVMHAWGGKNVNGVYYFACNDNGVTPISFFDAKQINESNPFDAVCNDFINQTKYNANKYFDFILIDEAQDFNPPFYQMCNSLVKDHKLVWGYDELQNIFDVKIQNVNDTFKNDFDPLGLDLSLVNGLTHKHNDIVLQKSYRNYKPILMWAVACGFGIYNERLIQSLENNEHWEDLGFKVLEGNCENHEQVKIDREPDNSPLKIPNSYRKDDFIKIKSYNSFEMEIEGVCDEIIRSIEEDGLRPDDIVIISIDDRNAGGYFRRISSKLNQKDIATYNVVSKNYIKGFQVENAVTLSTVYKAKGNEAAMVFVIGCDVVEGKKNNRNMRNRLFTAFTRAKVWLRMTGVNITNDSIYKELNSLKSKEYILEFINTPSNVLERDWKEYTERGELNAQMYEKIEEMAKRNDMSIEEYLKTFILDKG